MEKALKIEEYREIREKKERASQDLEGSEIYKLTGNSIVVPVLEQVFYEYFKALKDSGKLDDMDMAS